MGKIEFSRAGDYFHYIWAARQSLKMLNLNSDIAKITIERSLFDNIYNDKGQETTGEDVMDITEYCSENKINYYQLKHSVSSKDITG